MSDAEIQPTNKRLRYFNSQYLRVQDFCDEQTYWLDRQHRQNRQLYAAGVVEGLILSWVTRGKTLQIEPGAALDSQGRAIVVIDKVLLNGVEQPASAMPFTGTLPCRVVIAYQARESDPQAAMADAGGDQVDRNTRWDETPQLRFASDKDKLTKDEIVLGRLNAQGALDPTVRKLASLHALGNVGIGTIDPDGNRLRVTGGPVQFDGALTVTGATTLNGMLTVSDDTTLSGSLSVAQSQATSLGGALAVAQLTTLNGGLTVAQGQATNLTGALTVDGATMLKSGLTVTGAAALNTGLTVTGATTLNTGLTVTGKTTLSGMLTVSDDTTLSGGLSVAQAATLSDALTVTGATKLNSGLTVIEATTLNNGLTVGGTTTLSGSLSVAQATTLSAALTVDGATTLSGSLSIAQAATLGDMANPAASVMLGVAGDLRLAGNFYQEKQSFTISSADAGWYRIAATPGSASNVDYGVFELRWNEMKGAGRTGHMRFSVSCQWFGTPQLTVLSSAGFNNLDGVDQYSGDQGIQKLRLLSHYAEPNYVEFYFKGVASEHASSGVNVEFSLLAGYGWSLATPDSTPNNSLSQDYVAYEAPADALFATRSGIDNSAFAIQRNGDVSTGGLVSINGPTASAQVDLQPFLAFIRPTDPGKADANSAAMSIGKSTDGESSATRLTIALSSAATPPNDYGWLADATVLTLDGDGRLQLLDGAYSDGKKWHEASSRSVKQSIAALSLDAALEAVMALSPVTFQYRTSPDHTHVGFIAEDVPELVAAADRKGLCALDIAAALTRVVQAQQTTIAELKAAVEALKNR